MPRVPVSAPENFSASGADSFQRLIHARLAQPVPASVTGLADILRARYGEATLAVVFYGSCLRGAELASGVVDLYVIVSGYREAYPGAGSRLLARVLPPTVGYLEAGEDGDRVRAKYAVISLADFRHGTCGGWFHPYLWGRFAQPCALAWVRDRAVAEEVVGCLAGASATLLERTLPLAPDGLDAAGLWRHALELSYGTELRPEAPGRAAELVARDADYFAAAAEAYAGRAADPGLAFTAADGRFRVCVSRGRRLRARAAWRVRRVTGKLLSPLRWVKALATFEGGLDYAIWKLERHSGRHIELSERARRRPWLYLWGEILRLYREGVLR